MGANVFELEASLGLDSSKFKQGIKDAIDEAKKLQKELEKTGDEANDLGKEVDKEGKEATDGAEENKKLGKEVQTAGEHADKAKGKFAALGGAIKDGLEAAAKVGIAATGAAATGLTALVKQSVSEYSNYEQLVGGVDKLFGEASSKVQENAKNAFSTSGLSANEYMEQVTGFAASLIQATGRGEQQDLDQLEETLNAEYAATKQSLADQYDAVKESWNERIKASKAAKDGEAEILTKQRDEELKALKHSNEEQLNTLKAHNKDVLAETERANNQSTTTYESLEKAADLADVAMKAISDNVNTFGTDMSSVQNAFQGFAKQNYTMLDNLRLGYGGTKAEMERLIDDANEYAESIGEASDLNMNSFADIVTAIDLIQRKQGIAGTTAKEASGTITGSIGAVRASWKNLTVELAKADGDVGTAFDILGANVGKMVENMLPKVENALGGIGDLISKAAPEVISGVKSLLPKVLPSLVKSAGQLVGAVSQGMLQATPELLDMGKNALKSIAEGFTADDIKFEDSAIGVILGSITDNIPEYLGYAETILANLGNALINTDHAKLGEKFSKVITSGLNSITDLLADLDMNKVGQNIADFVKAVDWKAIAKSVVDLLGAALGSIGDIAAGFFENMDGETFLSSLSLIAAPKLLGSMLTTFKTNSACTTEFTSIKSFLSAEIGSSGEGAAMSWSSAFMVGIKAFGLGYAIGTYLRDNIHIGDKTLGEWIDYKMEGKDEEGNYSSNVFGVKAMIDDYKAANDELDSFTYTNKYGYTVKGYKYDIYGNETEAYKSYLKGQESLANSNINSKETFKYYANGGIQSAFKYDDFGNLSEAWKKYGGQAFAEGGRVTRPTIALVGEKEPETIIPDSKLASVGTTNYNTFNISIDGTGKNAEEIADEAIEVISTKLDILGIQQQRAVGGKSWA